MYVFTHANKQANIPKILNPTNITLLLMLVKRLTIPAPTAIPTGINFS